MNKKIRETVLQMRQKEGLSYSEILQKVNVAKSTLSYWLRDIELNATQKNALQKRLQPKFALRVEHFREAMQKKRQDRNFGLYKKYLLKFKKISGGAEFISGLTLYWGEGDKKNRSRIGVANTDPKLILFFKKWLHSQFEISYNVMRGELHLYENMNIAKEEKFWQDTLSLPKAQFYKTQVRKLQKGSFSYQESFRHGTCSLYVLGVKKKEELMAAIEAFADMYLK